MSDDRDFDMEIVEDEKLDELSASGASSSEKTVRSEPVNPKKSDGSKPEAQNYDSATAQEGSIPSNFGNQEDGEEKRFGPFTLNVPEEWRAERQGQVKQLFTRGKQPTYAEDGVPVINQECIYWNDWHFENLRFLDQGEAKDWPEKYFPKKGDIILNSTGQGTLGRAQVYPDKERRAVDSHVTILRTTDDLNPYFHRYFLESHLGQALLYSMCVNGSTGQIELSKTRLDLMPVPIPPLPEQRKIATVLYAVDQAIQKTEAIIEQTKRVKRGLMQRLFHHGLEETNDYQTTKYGSAPAHWEIKPISDLAIQVQAGGTPDTDREEFYDGKIPWIRTGELRQKRIRDPEKSITEAGFENSTVRLFPKNTVLVAMYGATAGESAMLDVEATSNQACCGVITDEEKILPEFLFQQLLYLKENLIALGAGSGQQNISKGIISNFRVLVPQLEEQTEIASILRIWDEEVEAGEKKREQLKRLKKGLMQDLLTGEVRTADKAIDVLDEVVEHG